MLVLNRFYDVCVYTNDISSWNFSEETFESVVWGPFVSRSSIRSKLSFVMDAGSGSYFSL